MNDKGELSDYSEVAHHPHEQMLKLVAKGFYRELIKYGVKEPEVVEVAGYLLDNIALKSNPNRIPLDTYSELFSIGDVSDQWSAKKCLSVDDVSLAPLVREDVDQVADWINAGEVANYFYPQFPITKDGLAAYFDASDRRYFKIGYKDEFVGIIGADQVDQVSSKLEMRKLVGDARMRGKGIGKRATFLFLYHAFVLLKYDKVYLHTLDINIRNLNLNGKFGFYLEGVFFEDVKIGEEAHDLVRMALTRSIWSELFS